MIPSSIYRSSDLWSRGRCNHIQALLTSPTPEETWLSIDCCGWKHFLTLLIVLAGFKWHISCLQLLLPLLLLLQVSPAKWCCWCELSNNKPTSYWQHGLGLSQFHGCPTINLFLSPSCDKQRKCWSYPTLIPAPTHVVFCLRLDTEIFIAYIPQQGGYLVHTGPCRVQSQGF